MGPRDPFGDAQATAEPPRRTRPAYEREPAFGRISPVHTWPARLTAGLAGVLAGLLLGVCILTGFVLEAVFLVFCGALGAGIAVVGYQVWTNELDVPGAWRALRGRA